MSSYILGRKRGMTQLFADDGSIVPVTVIAAGPCIVTMHRTEGRNGYNAVQVGFEPAKEKHLRKPQREFFKKGKLEPMRILKEFRVPAGEELPELGSEITVETFEPGSFVDVIGTSKGKGFAGTIKRHGFTLGPASHGSMNYRRPRSIGCSAYPSRVQKGKRMAGQMGNKRFTQKNLLVVGVDPANHLMFVRGSVPGAIGGLVQVVTAKTHIMGANEKIPTLLVEYAGKSAAEGEKQEA